MCFRIKKLQKAVDELTAIVKNREFVQLKEKEKTLTELQELLSHIHFKIKDIKEYEDEETNNKSIRVRYELPTVTLYLDENGEVSNKDEFFYSTNYLELISYEDMSKIQKVLEKNKKNNKIY